MAGIRCGLTIARPELQMQMGVRSVERNTDYSGGAGRQRRMSRSEQRKQISSRGRRRSTNDEPRLLVHAVRIELLYADEEAGEGRIAAMGEQKVYIGRIWPVWPTHVRITVGTQAEMAEFQTAYRKVMTGAVSVGYAPAKNRQRSLDGQLGPMTDGENS
jgi:histidinol-phosphate/aromatic aminotransferase/cobyric acid decarboxylase-like protein